MWLLCGRVRAQQPGERKTGNNVSFSTDLFKDVLNKYELVHLLLGAAWADARAKMTDVGRLADLLDRAAATMVHVTADRVTPLAVPVLTLIGRESVATGLADDALLAEAETLAARSEEHTSELQSPIRISYAVFCLQQKKT